MPLHSPMIYVCARVTNHVENGLNQKEYRIWKTVYIYTHFLLFSFGLHIFRGKNESTPTEWKSGNSPSHRMCCGKKKHWKWNGISFSSFSAYTLNNKTEKQTGFLCSCVCVGTTRELNDNRKMVFPCSYLNMLSGSERSSFVSYYVVDNIFHLVWQAFFPFRYISQTFRKGKVG